MLHDAAYTLFGRHPRLVEAPSEAERGRREFGKAVEPGLLRRALSALGRKTAAIRRAPVYGSGSRSGAPS